jgi:hypothetical protein
MALKQASSTAKTAGLIVIGALILLTALHRGFDGVRISAAID